jgi:large conductance mechanosensitive channel
MSVLKEFKEFAMKGNVVDLAVGVIIGAAFGKIVSSLVGDVIMPGLGILMGQVNLSDLAFSIPALEGGKPAVVIAYGKFLQTILDFIIVAFAIFMAVKGMNRLKKKEEAKPEAKQTFTKDQELLMEIRDALTKKK